MSDYEDFGEKKISYFQSCCLLLNNVTGAAMVLYPGLFQQAGWLLPMICMFCIASLSAISGLCLIKTMQMIPGNEKFQQRFEFTNVAEHFFSPRQYRVVFVFFVLSLFASVIPLIIQSAQVMDFTLVAIFGQSCGLRFYPAPVSWQCASDMNDVDPFGSNVVVFSVGVVVLALLCIPVGYWNLDDNMNIQVGATFSMLTIIGVWVVYFCQQGLHTSSMPLIGTDFSKILGIVVFNYTFVTTLPSWVNEKAAHVSTVKSALWSLSLATLVFIVVGVFGAIAFPPFFDTNADLLDKLNQSGNTVARVSYFLFPLVVNLTSIPIVCIIIRYNLMTSHFISKRMASFLAVIFPWLLTIPFYTGAGFNEVVTWTGIFVNGVVNFIIPVYMYILAVRKYGHITPVKFQSIGKQPLLANGDDKDLITSSSISSSSSSSLSSSANLINVEADSEPSINFNQLSSSSSNLNNETAEELNDEVFIDPLHLISSDFIADDEEVDADSEFEPSYASLSSKHTRKSSTLSLSSSHRSSSSSVDETLSMHSIDEQLLHQPPACIVCCCPTKQSRWSRTTWAWLVITTFASLLLLTIGVDIYYLAEGNSLV